MNSVSSALEILHRLGEVGAVDVGDEAEGHASLAVMLQRLVGHDRTKVGAADADVDHIADPLAGMAFPVAAADAVGEVCHLVQNRMHVGHHIPAVDEDRSIPWRAQRHMESGPPLRDIDLLAAEHGIDALAQARLLRKLEQQLQRLVSDAVLRIVEIDPDGLGGQPFTAPGVVGEQLAKMDALDLLMMVLQGHPGGTLAQRCNGHRSCPR